MEIKKDEEGNVIEPTTEELKAKLAEVEEEKRKIEEEKDNYKKGLLEREAKLKELKSSDDSNLNSNEDEDDSSDWDEASKKFQQETISKTEKKAEEVVAKAIESKNEKQAIADFRDANPEITDEDWAKIVLNYDPKNGKDSPKAIIKDLERANVLRMFDAGEKIDPAELRKTDAQNRLRDLSTSTGAAPSGRYEEDAKTVSEGQISIASRMRVAPEELEKEDDSLSAEIKIS